MNVTVYGPSVSRGYRQTLSLYNVNNSDFKKKVGDFAKRIGFASPNSLTIKKPEANQQSLEIDLPSEITSQISKYAEKWCDDGKKAFIGVVINTEIQYTVPFTEKQLEEMEQNIDIFLTAYNELYRIYWEKDKMLKEYGV